MPSTSLLSSLAAVAATLAAASSAAVAAGSDRASVPVARAAGSVRSAERLIRQCANRERARAGLSPLVASPALGRAARLHARNMARWRFFDHDDPLGRDPSARLALFDTTGVFAGAGENIAGGYRSVAATCDGWMRSPGHRDNILGDYTHVGGGYARGGGFGRYYVQVFASPSYEPEPNPLPDEGFPDEDGEVPGT